MKFIKLHVKVVFAGVLASVSLIGAVWWHFHEMRTAKPTDISVSTPIPTNQVKEIQTATHNLLAISPSNLAILKLKNSIANVRTEIENYKAAKDTSQRREHLERLLSIKYEIFTINGEFRRLARERQFNKSDLDLIDSKSSQIEKDIDRIYAQGKYGETLPSEINFGSIPSINTNTENNRRYNARGSSLPKIPKQISTPPTNKTSALEIFKALIAEISILPSADATEVLNCSTQFFSDPVQPFGSGSAYLDVSRPENQSSTELDSMIQKLQSAIQIFKYVKDQVGYEPYVGAVQNASSVFLRQSGNAHDKANLLLTMLRKAGVPARYVFGDILVSEAVLMKQWRVTDAMSVYNMHIMLFPNLESVRAQTRYFTIAGSNYYVLPHVWVEAYVPFDQRRGAGIQTSTQSWIPLDPTIEEVNVRDHSFLRQSIETRSILASIPLFDFDKYMLQPDPETGNVVKLFSADQQYVANVINLIGIENSYSTAVGSYTSNWIDSFANLQNRGDKAPANDSTYPIGPSGDEACISQKVAILPDSEKVKFKYELPGISATISAVDIGAKALYIIYTGVTTTDTSKLDQISNGQTVSSVGINVKPVLYLDDQVLATGTSVPYGDNSGQLKQTRITLKEVSGNPPYYFSHTHYFTTGQSIGLSSSIRQTSMPQISQRITDLTALIASRNSATLSAFEKSKLTGKVLSAALAVAVSNQEKMAINISAASDTIDVNNLDLVVMHAGMTPNIIFDRMLGFVPQRPVIDWVTSTLFLTRASSTPITSNGYWTSTSSLSAAAQVHSIAGSSLENQIFEDFFSIPGQSTIKVIQGAGDLHVPVLSSTVDINSYPSLISQTRGYDTSFLNQINATINEFGGLPYGGLTAQFTMPKNPVTIAGNTFQAAYYFNKQNSSFFDYIGGSLGGIGADPSSETPTGVTGSTINTDLVDITVEPGSSDTSNFSSLLPNDSNLQSNILKGPAVGGCKGSTGAPVNFSNGAMWHTFQDISPLSIEGVPLSFSRTYLSQSNYNGVLGYGWTHNLNMRIVSADASALNFASNQSLIYFDAVNNANPISFLNGVAVLNPSSRLKFQKANGYYVLTDDRYTTFKFFGSGSQIGLVQSITDTHGNFLNFTYDPITHLLSQVTDRVGRRFSFDYDNSGRILKVSDMIGRNVQFTYNSNGDLATSRDLNSNITTYTYLTGQVNAALNHNLSSFRDPLGFGIDYFYYQNDKVFKHIEPQGKQTTFIYNTFNRETTVIDVQGRQKTYQYDSFGNVTKTINPDGTYVARKFDIYGNKVQETDEEGFVTSFKTDSRGNTVKVTPPAPFGPTIYTYHSTFNTPVSIQDGNGNFKDFTIDSTTGDVLSETVYAGSGKATPRTTSYTYQADGRLSSIRDARGNSTTFSRTRNGDLSESVVVQDPSGSTSTSVFDPIGRAIDVTDFNGKHTLNTFDNFGKLLTSQVQGSQLQFKNTYDAVGNLISAQRIAGGQTFTTSFTYDGLKNKSSVTDENGNTTRLAYVVPGCGCGIESQMSSIVDPKGNKTQYAYDWRGKVTQILDPRGNSTIIKYDGRGNQLSLTVNDKNGHSLFSTKNQYGPLNKLTRQIDFVPYSNSLSQNFFKQFGYSGNIQTTVDFTYDQAGNLVDKQTARSYLQELKEVSYSYLPSGQISQKSLSSTGLYGGTGSYNPVTYSDTITYTYDQNFNVLSLINRDSELHFTYDPLNRVSSASTVTNVGAGILQPSSQLSYQYDKMGQITGISDSSSSVANFSYDSQFRLSQISNPQGSATFSYDPSNRVTSLAYSNGKTTTFSYDPGNRLVSMSTPGLSALNLAYDQNGNIKSLSSERGQWDYGYDQSSWLIRANYSGNAQIANEAFAWDAAGNQAIGGAISNPATYDFSTAVPTRPLLFNNSLLEDATSYSGVVGRFAYRYDLAGSVMERYDNLNNIKNYYYYDAENRLKLMKTVSVAANVDTPITQTSYKYDGLGRRVSFETNLANGTSDRTAYVYDGDNILFEYDKTAQKRATYIGTRAIDNHLMMIRDGKIHFFHTDHLGSVIALSDSLGNVEQRMSYSAFGQITNIQDGNNANRTLASIPVKNPFAFAGREWDSDTAQYYFRARYYDPSTGRFLAKDPLLPVRGGDINSYRYSLNNPMNLVDPTGNAAIEIGGSLSGFFGAGAGAGAQYTSSYAATINNSTGQLQGGTTQGGAVNINGFGASAGASLYASFTPFANSISDLAGPYVGVQFDTPILSGGITIGSSGPTFTLGIGPTAGASIHGVIGGQGADQSGGMCGQH